MTTQTLTQRQKEAAKANRDGASFLARVAASNITTEQSAKEAVAYAEAAVIAFRGVTSC